MITPTPTPPHPTSPCLVCTESMDVDLEGIIQCIKQGDESGVQAQLQGFNKEVMKSADASNYVCKPLLNHSVCVCVSHLLHPPAVRPVLLLRCRGEGAEEGKPPTHPNPPDSRPIYIQYISLNTPPLSPHLCFSANPPSLALSYSPPPPALHCLVCD